MTDPTQARRGDGSDADPELRAITDHERRVLLAERCEAILERWAGEDTEAGR